MSAEIIYALICGTATTIIVFEFVVFAVLVLIIVDYKIIFVAMLGPFFVLSTYFGSRYVIKLIGLEGFVPSGDWPQYAVTLIEIMLIIALIWLYIRSNEKKEEERYRNSLAEEHDKYKNLYEQICRTINGITSEDGSIEFIEGRPSAGIAYMPDGRVRIVDFGTELKDWLICSDSRKNIRPSDKAEDILANPDVMIAKSGVYKGEAAIRIINRTIEECESIKEDLLSSTLWMNGRSLIYATKEGKVRKAVFDLPADILFPDLTDEDASSDDFTKHPASVEEIISAVEKGISC